MGISAEENTMPEYLEIPLDKFTFRVATDRSYSPDGVWLQDLGDSRIRVGVTDFVQQHSGDVAFASAPKTGTTLAAGDEFAALETVKVNLSLALPISGTVLEVNPALDTSPEVINQDPYGDGWLVVIHAVAWEADRAGLLAPAAYLSAMQGQVQQELDRQ
jgi:glycine cleavage system H protein